MTPAGEEAVALGGLDIGGTKIEVAIGDSTGRVIAKERIANDPELGPEELLESALELLDRLETSTGAPAIRALGVASPGPLDAAAGRLLEVPNMPRWQHFDLRDFLSDRHTIPVGVMNDANASVLAEWYWGAARGANTALFLTMSTGMGAGLLVDGRVFAGPLGLAGEIGHLRLREDGPVGFGKRGSVEGYLSGPGIVQVAEAEALVFRQAGRGTALHGGTITPERVCALARDGDAAALAVVDRCGHELGRLCAWLVDVFNPDVIVLGTIGSAHDDLFVPRAREVVDREALGDAARHVRIVPSGLDDRGSRTALAIARTLDGAADG